MRTWLALAVAAIAMPAAAEVGVISNPAVGSSLLLRAGNVSLYDVNVVSGANAGYIMVFDSATVPADGAVTPKMCLPLAANTGIDINMRSNGMYLPNGAVITFSTTGCFTLTKSSTAFIAGSIQ